MIENINLEVKEWDWRRQTIEEWWITSAQLIARIEWWTYKTKKVKVNLSTIDIWSYTISASNLFDFAVHYKLVENADLKYPIILNKYWTIVDWRHRLLKAILRWDKYINWIMVMNDKIYN